jgi:hypothetical protein
VMSSALRRLLAPRVRNAKGGAAIATPRIREVGFQTEVFLSGGYVPLCGCHAALNSRTGNSYFSALSAFLLQSHCTEITDVCSQIADNVRDEVWPRFECKSGNNGKMAGEAAWGVALQREAVIRPLPAAASRVSPQA